MNKIITICKIGEKTENKKKLITAKGETQI